MDTITVPTRLTREVAIIIHNILHDPVNYPTGCEVWDRVIKLGSNGCRCIQFPKTLFMVQNKDKNSKHAQLAREGWKITWGIRDFGSWSYIATNPDGEITEVKL